MENLSHYIAHPERLNRDTLYELRLIVGKYPYFDVARLLMLTDLYLLHDIDFGNIDHKNRTSQKNVGNAVPYGTKNPCF